MIDWFTGLRSVLALLILIARLLTCTTQPPPRASRRGNEQSQTSPLVGRGGGPRIRLRLHTSEL